MNIFDRIEQDHVKQRRLMDTLVNTEGDSAEREKVFKEFDAEYRAHAAAEEQVFYAALMENPDGTDKSRHSVAEHMETMKLLKELADTDMSSPGWLVTMKKIQHDNEHHIEEEEDEVFPHARKVMPEGEIDDMGTQFEERKAAELNG